MSTSTTTGLKLFSVAQASPARIWPEWVEKSSFSYK